MPAQYHKVLVAIAMVVQATVLLGADITSIVIPMEFRHITPISDITHSFTVGGHSQATDSVDSDLGEVEIPPFPPPGGTFYVWSELPLTEHTWLDKLDLRPIPVQDTVTVYYRLGVNYLDGQLEVSVHQLPKGVDSAWIIDAYSDFPDFIVGGRIEKNFKLTVNNPTIRKFIVMVWYNTKSTSVSYPNVVRSVVAFPNPASSSVLIKSDRQMCEINLVDSYGRSNPYLADDIQSTIDVRQLAPGSYSLIIRYCSGALSVSRVIITR